MWGVPICLPPWPHNSPIVVPVSCVKQIQFVVTLSETRGEVWESCVVKRAKGKQERERVGRGLGGSLDSDRESERGENRVIERGKKGYFSLSYLVKDREIDGEER